MNNFTVNRQDNAWHYSNQNQYIEWWYLDALFSDYYYLSGSFGIWGSLKKPESLMIRSDFLLTMPNGSTIDFGEKFSLTKFSASLERCNVHLGKNSLVDAGNCYNLHLIKDSVALNLTYVPTSPGFKHTHFFNEQQSEYFSWVVPMPCAGVHGSLQINEKSIALNGFGYHDHNWASISLSQKINGWQWGRIQSGKEIITFALVEGISQTLFKGMAFSSGSKFEYLKFGLPFPIMNINEIRSGWALSLTDDNIELHLEITEKKEVLHRDGGSSYRRYLSRVNGKITTNKEYIVSGQMIHEFQNLH